MSTELHDTSRVLNHSAFKLFDKLTFETAVIKPPFTTPNIMHNEACFLYIKQGSNDLYSEIENVRVTATESVLMKCGNFIGKLGPSEVVGVYEAVAVHFYPDVLKKVYANEIPDILKRRSDSDIVPQMTRMAADKLIHKYVESLTFYFENPGLVTEDLLVLKIKELILLLSKSSSAVIVHRILSNLFSPTTYQFRQVIDAHLFKPVTVEELAMLTNLSVSSFKREFKRVYNSSPASFIRQKKLERAAELLLASDENVSNIAWDCGFQDLTHFSRLFKQTYGSSPRDFRVSQNANQVD